MPPKPARQRRPLATSPFTYQQAVVPTTDGFHVGDRVTLDRYGMGRVTAVSEDYVTVEFGEGDVRRLPAGTPGLTPL